MSTVSRRSILGGAAAAAGSLALGNKLASASPAASRRSTGRLAQGEKITLNVYDIWGTAQGAAAPTTTPPFIELINKFNETSTTTEIKEQTPGGYPDVLTKTQADLAAGNPPDVICVPWAFLTFAVEGLGLGNLADVVGDQMDSLKGLISDSAWPLTTYTDGNIKGLPWGLSTPILYYNADLFDQIGAKPEDAFKTWDSLNEVLPDLGKATNGGYALSFNTNRDWPTQTLVQSNGGRILEADGKTFGFTSDEAKAAIQTIADISAKGLFDTGAAAEMTPNFEAGLQAIGQFSTGVGAVRKASPFNLGTSTWPKFGDNPIKSSTGGSFLAVFTKDESKFAAVTEFLKFAAGPIGYPIWHQQGYINVSTQELDMADPGQQPAYDQFKAGLERETNWPGSRGLEIQQTWQTMCDRMYSGDISVEDGTAQAADQMSQLIS